MLGRARLPLWCMITPIRQSLGLVPLCKIQSHFKKGHCQLHPLHPARACFMCAAGPAQPGKWANVEPKPAQPGREDHMSRRLPAPSHTDSVQRHGEIVFSGVLS